MADDPKPNEGAAPAFDAGAFMSELETKVGSLLDQKLPKTAAITYPYAGRPPAKQEPVADDPMATLVDPYVQRAVSPLKQEVANANLRAQMAEDRAAFYAAHPDLKPEVRERVEQAAQRLAEAGSPFVRE